MLALKYRPQSLEDVVGQKAVTVVLARMVLKERVPPALLFSGPKGSGKTSAARALASALGATAGTSALIELDAASHGGVAEVRALTSELAYRCPSGQRVVILDEVQSFSREAFNALLKLLEEPPPATTFILVTTAPMAVPETVLSRLMQFEFTLISLNDINARLLYINNEEKLDISSELIREISLRSQGSLRHAVMTLDQCHRADITTTADYLELIGSPDLGPGLLTAMLARDIPTLLTRTRSAVAALGAPQAVAEQLTATLRDVLVLRVRGTLSGLAEPALEARVTLARALDTPATTAALQLLWDLRAKTRPNENPHLALELAVVLVCDLLAAGRPEQSQRGLPPALVHEAAQAHTATGSEPLTLDQLRELM